jgi:ParB-like chromosome segregation protein Spo0J
MRIEEIIADQIVVPPRMRTVDNARVKALADSMDAIGLQQPITVWAEQDGDIYLIAGAHRVEAAKLLKLEWIDAVFMDTDE